MKNNMGKLDKAIRIGIAGVLLVLYVTNTINGAWAIIGLVVSGLMVVTSFINWCPLYTVFGWNTGKKD